ncbi:MAG: hypothetical protein QG597_1378 [Actinomycetota bacterium]|nr:hypothetical protein [Actinomycetota bacterium]
MIMPRNQRRTVPESTRRSGDEGIGMITVIGMTSAIAITVALTVTVAINSLTSSANHQTFETSLAAAETGLDGLIGDIQTAYDMGVNYLEDEDVCTARWDTTSPPAPNAEKAWLEAEVMAMPSSCVQDAGGGQYVAFRAITSTGVAVPVLYSLGWTPSVAAPENPATPIGVTMTSPPAMRAIRAEYLFSPFRPNQAVVTQANLVFSGSVEVDLASNSSATSADVHSNSNVDAGNNSLKVKGNITASGTNTKAGTCPDGKITGTCTQGDPPVAIPSIRARSIYRALARETQQGWYDLCPDGTVTGPDLSQPNQVPDPCTGELLSPSGTFRGWTLEDEGTAEATWVFTPTDGTDYPGAYYVYQANASLEKGKGNKGEATMSVMAEAKANGWPSHTATCNKSGGTITWKHANISNYLPGVLFVADTAVIGEANSDVGVGVIAAGDYVDWKTSSSTVTGSLMASANCATSPTNTIQGVTITYDSSSEVPLTTMIRTTQWLEMVG